MWGLIPTQRVKVGTKPCRQKPGSIASAHATGHIGSAVPENRTSRIAHGALHRPKPVPARADTTVAIAITHYEQNKSQWCWATAAEVVIRAEGGGTRTQCTYVKDAKGYSDSHGCTNVTGTGTNIEYLINKYLGIGGHFVGDETKLNWNQFVSDVNANRPSISIDRMVAGGSHYVTDYKYKISGAAYYVYYSNADAAVGTGAAATKEYRSLSNFHSNATFRNYDNMQNIRN